MNRLKNARHFWLFVFATLTVLAIDRPAFAQGIVRGTVNDIKGQPVEGATVLIEGVDSGRKFETKTDKIGEYTQIGLPNGAYRVTASKDKLSTSNQVSVRQAGRTILNFVLVPAGTLTSAKGAQLAKMFQAGVDADKAGNHDEAIAKFTEAIAFDSLCADCYFNMGLSQAAKKDYEKAEASFKKAIELKPDHAGAYNGLANLYNTQRKFDEAQAASAKAAELSGGVGGAAGGGSVDALYNQGVIFWNQGKIAEAKKQFEAALASNPNHAESHYQLGMALVNEGNLKGAAEQFDTYLKLAPDGPNATQAKALVAQLPK